MRLLAKSIGLYGLFIAVLLIKIWPTLSTPYYTYGDIASDMLLSDIWSQAVMTHGHYSRFGFYHPGSFFLTFSKAIEILLAEFIPAATRTNLWLLGNCFINSLWMWMLTVVAADLMKGVKWRWGFAISSVLILVVYLSRGVTDLWMPFRLILPYLVLVTGCIHLGMGSLRFLPFVAFAIGALCHGYVTMPVLILGPVAAAGILYFLSEKKEKISILSVYLSAAILFMFGVPFILDLLSGNSNILRIAQGTGAVSAIGHSGVRTSISIFWNELVAPVNLVVFSVLGIFVAWRTGHRNLVKSIGGVTAATLVMTIAYGAWSPPPLHFYMLLFSSGILIIPLVILLSYLLTWISHKNQWAGALFALYFFASVLGGLYRHSPKILNSPESKILANQLESFSAGSELGGKKYVIDFDASPDDILTWAYTMGLLVEARALGYEVCTSNSGMRWQAGPVYWCPDLKPSLIVKSRRLPDGATEYFLTEL